MHFLATVIWSTPKDRGQAVPGTRSTGTGYLVPGDSCNEAGGQSHVLSCKADAGISPISQGRELSQRMTEQPSWIRPSTHLVLFGTPYIFVFGNYRAAINIPIGFLTVPIIPLTTSRLRNQQRKDTRNCLRITSFVALPPVSE